MVYNSPFSQHFLSRLVKVTVCTYARHDKTSGEGKSTVTRPKDGGWDNEVVTCSVRADSDLAQLSACGVDEHALLLEKGERFESVRQVVGSRGGLVWL